MLIGLTVAAIARLLVPARRPMGLVGTALAGIAGSVVAGLQGGVFGGWARWHAPSLALAATRRPVERQPLGNTGGATSRTRPLGTL